MMQKSDNGFMASFYPDVRRYFKFSDGIPSFYPARWFLDAFQLSNQSWPNNYGDYSFIVVPASKALESWIFQIAGDIGVKITTNKVGLIRDQIEKVLDQTLTSVEKKLGDSIKTDIAFLKSFIKDYRHDIVHASDKRIDNPQQAKNKVIVIFEIVNNITQKLIDADQIKL